MFRAPCGSGGGGWVDGGGGCPHTHAHTCTCGKHDNFTQMAAPIGESLGIPYDVIHMCMCVHVHVCGGTLSPPSTHIHPPPTPQGGPPESVKMQ